VKETTKAYQRRRQDPFWNEVFVGDGIDIGSGDDPFRVGWFPGVKSVKTFDRKDGDAQYLTRYVSPNSYDFVHSSHCLEHLNHPCVLFEWLHVVKTGGHLVFMVPDEDLYEQGVFPSRWNADHKRTFTFKKQKSWSRQSVNLADVLAMLPFCQIRRIGLIDTNYDYTITGIDQTNGNAEAAWEVVLRKMPVVHKKSAFKHSGARGDLIYSLPTIQALGGGTLYINRKGAFHIPMSDDEFVEVREFLKKQSYIDAVKDWDGQEVDYDLDLFRNLYTDYTRLMDVHLESFGVHYPADKPWIEPDTIKPIFAADIVVNRTQRYHGTFDWQELKPWQDRCVFVGSKAEYVDFQNTTGLFMPFRATSKWSELAAVIRGAKLFVGNQSFPYALAEAMKVPRVLETHQVSPNCDPRGQNGHTRLTQGIIRKYLLGEQTDESYSCVESRNPHDLMLFQKLKKGKVATLPTCIVIPACGRKEMVSALVEDIKSAGLSVIVQETGSSFEEMANLGAAKASGQIICIVDADAGVTLAEIETVRDQLLDGKTGMAGACTCLKFKPHLSGPCIAVTRRAYEQMGLFNPAMLPGEVNMLELNLRYARGRYGCKSAALPRWAKWNGSARDKDEWDKLNLKYIAKVYG